MNAPVSSLTQRQNALMVYIATYHERFGCVPSPAQLQRAHPRLPFSIITHEVAELRRMGFLRVTARGYHLAEGIAP